MQMGHVEQGRAYKALQKPQEEKERAERTKRRRDEQEEAHDDLQESIQGILAHKAQKDIEKACAVPFTAETLLTTQGAFVELYLCNGSRMDPVMDRFCTQAQYDAMRGTDELNSANWVIVGERSVSRALNLHKRDVFKDVHVASQAPVTLPGYLAKALRRYHAALGDAKRPWLFASASGVPYCGEGDVRDCTRARDRINRQFLKWLSTSQSALGIDRAPFSVNPQRHITCKRFVREHVERIKNDQEALEKAIREAALHAAAIDMNSSYTAVLNNYTAY